MAAEAGFMTAAVILLLARRKKKKSLKENEAHPQRAAARPPALFMWHLGDKDGTCHAQV